MMKKNGFASNCMMLARGILADQLLRRKMMAQLVIFLLVICGIGGWVIDDWLRDSLVRFMIFWGFVFFYTLFIIMMACYDMLKTLTER